MTNTLKILTALPLIALLSACMAGGNTVSSEGELEATLDEDIDGDGTIPGPGGAELATGS
jgi:hypothetical protein